MSKSIKILIVEDSDLFNERLTEGLSSIKGSEIAGYADDSMDAIDKYFEIHPDILILDLMLKSGTGFEVLESIKHRSNHCKVIVFTNYSYPFINKSCIETGADYFLDKSNDFEKLINICEAIIKECTTKPMLSVSKIIKHHSNKRSFIRSNKLLAHLFSPIVAILKLRHKKLFKYSAIFQLVKMMLVSILLITGFTTKNQLAQNISKVAGNVWGILQPANIFVYSLPFFNSLSKISFNGNPYQDCSNRMINEKQLHLNDNTQMGTITVLSGIGISYYTGIFTNYMNSMESDQLFDNYQVIVPDYELPKSYLVNTKSN